jgi:hypothetical protein
MKHTFNFLYAIFALSLLCFAACKTEVGTSQETKTCVVGPNNLGGSVADIYDDEGRYAINWTAVPNVSKYVVTTTNESDNNRLLRTDTVFNAAFAPPPKTYTCDSILFRVKPILPNGTLCIPQGQDVRLSRPRGGITAIILDRTSGNTCGTGLQTLQAFNDSSFVLSRTPIVSAFSDSVRSLSRVQNTFDRKILNNADSTGYLKIIVKNCAGVVTNTRNESVNRNQTRGILTNLSTVIVGAAGRAGITNPSRNTNAFIENIRFEK